MFTKKMRLLAHAGVVTEYSPFHAGVSLEYSRPHLPVPVTAVIGPSGRQQLAVCLVALLPQGHSVESWKGKTWKIKLLFSELCSE